MSKDLATFLVSEISRSEALWKPLNDLIIDKTVLRQAQHERQKPNESNARLVRSELIEGCTSE